MRTSRIAPLCLLLPIFLGLAGKAWAAQPDTIAIDLLPDTDASTAATNDTAPGTTNAEECDADPAALNGPAWEDRDADPLNVVHLVCVSATEAGTASNGEMVTLTTSGVGTIVDATGAPASNTAQIDSGYAKFYITSTVSGLQTLTATVDGATVSDTAQKYWQPAQCPGFESLATGKKGKGKGGWKSVTHIVGTPWDDVLTGTPGKNVICGLEGNDVLNGLQGRDLLLGGEGNDTLNGANGKDALYGDTGQDVLIGGNGKDLLDGGPDADDCSGGRGKDTEQAC